MTGSVVPRIWTKAGFVEDRARDEGTVFMSPEELTSRIGSGTYHVLVLQAGDDPGSAAGRIAEIDAVFLRFATFSDGRAFSVARLLRDKYGFGGTIRAEGPFILDQIPLLLRVGVDQFAISHGPTAARLQKGELPAIDLYMQPAIGPECGAGQRAWARRRSAD